MCLFASDDSEVTLNISLNEGYEGGENVFHGLRGSVEAGAKSPETITGRDAGMAFLHLGQHLHGVTPVTAGERNALIMWCRSSSYRSAVCPCCLTHRRETKCIANPDWN
jgi:predicted 2-oxoglutarate/Fe(II)-dependent dioxygenase YbiX